MREALADGPATRREIWEHLRRDAALADLEVAASGAGSDALYKPLHWWGDICFGPDRDGASTFRLLTGDPRWSGTPEPDDAGPQAVRDYLASYAPVTHANLRYWLTEGLSAPWRRVTSWLAALGDEVTTVEVDGTDAFVLTADLEDMAGALPDDGVLHLPAFDPWVNGPGTADERVVPPALRAEVSRGRALEVRGGVVVATRGVSDT